MTPQMPKRTREHELADAGVLEFRRRFPKWVIRSLEENDYGVDAEVEVFDLDGHATGITFKAQIKATDSEAKSNRLSVRINRSTLNYWRSLDVPVLVYVYSVADDQGYARWAHSYDQAVDSRRQIRSDSRKLTFPFRLEHQIQQWTYSRLTEELHAIRALKARVSLGSIPVRVRTDGQAVSDSLMAAIESELINAFSTARGIFQVAENEATASALVQISTERVRFSMPAEISSGTIWRPRDGLTVLSQPSAIAADILLLGACVLSNIGLHQKAKTLGDMFAGSASFPHLGEFTGNLVLSYLDQDDPEGAVKFIVPLLLDSEVAYRQAGEIAVAPLVLGETSTLTQDAFQILMDALVASGEMETAQGNSAMGANRIYLAGGLARARKEFDAAVSLYRRLPDWEASYEDRGYYYRELGGAFADLGRWHEAAASYRKAIATSDQTLSDIHFVLADALLHSGNYSEALAESAVPDSKDVFVRKSLLVSHVARFVVDSVGRTQQDRAQLVQVNPPEGETSFPPTAENSLRRLASTDALDLTLIDHLIAAAATRDEEDNSTLGLFITKAWLELDNTASWLIAIAIAISLDDQLTAEALAESMYQFCRPHVFEALGELSQVMAEDEFSQLRTIVSAAGRRESYRPPNFIRIFKDDEAPVIIEVPE